MSNFISNFIRKKIVRSLLKDVLSEFKSRFERIELLLQTFNSPLQSTHGDGKTTQAGSQSAGRSFDLIISHIEICPRHGSGVLLMRLFGKSECIINLRSQTHFGGSSIGDVQLELKHTGISRLESFLVVGQILRHYSIRRILCVPLYPDDLMTAVAAHELLNVPLCLFLMDDQNIHHDGIPDDLMKEAIERARLRLAIGPEMRDAYEKKFGQKFWMLPPVVPGDLIGKAKAPSQITSSAAILIGNFWSSAWLKELRKVVRQSGITVHWYGNSADHIPTREESQWAEDGIHAHGFVEENQLLECLRNHAFAIVPVGTIAPRDTHQWQAELSIPSRIPFLAAVANIPIIVLATKENPAANFVRRFDLGKVCNYEPKSIRAAVAEICSPEAQLVFRANAARMAEAFSDEGVGDWIWSSLELGKPCNEKFENLFK